MIMAKKSKKSSNNSRVDLEVSLDTTLNPQVIISNLDLNAGGRSIRWIRKPGETFTFVRLNALDQANFNEQSIKRDRTRVSCNNRAPDSGGTVKYWYEIVVDLNGLEYKSTKTGPNPGDKPVIRN
jgi:hypothetical protein